MQTKTITKEYGKRLSSNTAKLQFDEPTKPFKKTSYFHLKTSLLSHYPLGKLPAYPSTLSLSNATVDFIHIAITEIWTYL